MRGFLIACNNPDCNWEVEIVGSQARNYCPKCQKPVKALPVPVHVYECIKCHRTEIIVDSIASGSRLHDPNTETLWCDCMEPMVIVGQRRAA